MSSSQPPALAPLHVYAIDALVQKTGRPLEEVAELYLSELTRLQSGARIQDYLVLLTSRRVRDTLLGKQAGFLNPSAFNPLPDRDVG